MLTKEQVAFLLELMGTPGIAYPMEKARIAVSTEDELRAMQKGFVNPLDVPDED